MTHIVRKYYYNTRFDEPKVNARDPPVENHWSKHTATQAMPSSDFRTGNWRIGNSGLVLLQKDDLDQWFSTLEARRPTKN